VALKVRIGTMEVEMENVEQVAELIRRLGQSAASPQTSPREVPESGELPLFGGIKSQTFQIPVARTWDRDAAWSFLSALSGTAKSFMGALLVAKSLSSGDMAKKLGIQPNLLGPAIRSIKSQSAHLQKRLPFEQKSEPGRAGKTYSITHDFFAAASQPDPRTGGQR
jgi:hypothetical protein